MLVGNLSKQGTVLLSQSIELILHCLCLHLIQLSQDRLIVSICLVTEHQSVGICRIIDGVCLLTDRQLDVAVHCSYGIVGLAAAFCQLGSDSVVTLHDSSQNLISIHAHLITEVANLLT